MNSIPVPSNPGSKTIIIVQPGGKVTISTESDDKFYHIFVIDTGIGISAENINKLFEPFNCFATENSNVEGTGIGLALTKRLVELLGGTIEVKSELNKGSTFSIKMPFKLS